MKTAHILKTVSVAVTLFGTSAAFGDVSFQGLGGTSTYNSSYAGDISADGSVVIGRIFSAWSGTSSPLRWTETTGLRGLPDLPGGSTLWRNCFALGVSADGAVIVGAGTSAYTTYANEACRWIAPDYNAQGLGYPPRGRAVAVSADGSVILGTNSVDGAFRWTEATGMIGLGEQDADAAAVSADGSVVVGTLNGEAFRWTAATGFVGLGFLPGTANSVANRVSEDGSVVVGTSGLLSGHEEAFRWTAATGMVGLGHLPGTSNSQAIGVSGDGSVIVGVCDNQAVVWDAVNGMRILRDVLVIDLGLDLTGWQLHRASDVSADGRRIVGSGRNPSGQAEAWLAVIPDLTITTPVYLDILPGGCPNRLNTRFCGRGGFLGGQSPNDGLFVTATPDKPKKGPVLPVAILGTEDSDVNDIAESTVMLEGVPVLRWNLGDVGTPVNADADECECNDYGADGFADLTLMFDRSAIVQALGAVYDGEVIPLAISGELEDGTQFEGTDCVVIVGGTEVSAFVPGSSQFGLTNYPNPVNPATQIKFSLPEASATRLEVYNVMGQTIELLVDSHLPQGSHEVYWNASDRASGVYFYRLSAGGVSETRRMLLLK